MPLKGPNPAYLFGTNSISLSAHSADHLEAGKDLVFLSFCSAALPPKMDGPGKCTALSRQVDHDLALHLSADWRRKAHALLYSRVGHAPRGMPQQSFINCTHMIYLDVFRHLYLILEELDTLVRWTNELITPVLGRHVPTSTSTTEALLERH